MLKSSSGPAPDNAGGLTRESVGAKTFVAELKNRAATEQRVHLLILPGPNQRAANQVPGLGIYRHATEAGGDERITVTDGNHFLAFERQKEKLEDRLARGFAIISAQEIIELLLGFLCDGFHEEKHGDLQAGSD